MVRKLALALVAATVLGTAAMAHTSVSVGPRHGSGIHSASLTGSGKLCAFPQPVPKGPCYRF